MRVVDGDTIHVRVGDRIEKVRYIGINTPEVRHPQKGEEPGGREAADDQSLAREHASRAARDRRAGA